MAERATPVLRASATDAALEPDPLAPAQIVAGAPETSSLVLACSEDGAESGIWRCTPGSFRDLEVDETFVVLEGRATIAHPGGEVEVGPGDVCRLAAGTETLWTVHETLLKGYRLAAPRDPSA
ncbi:MAG: DUF861 domain-containing protein [Solirubrobacterales bacterium]|nr:DUF861 domain-containing protein [Solirubrobacterales bacterium]